MTYKTLEDGGDAKQLLFRASTEYITQIAVEMYTTDEYGALYSESQFMGDHCLWEHSDSWGRPNKDSHFDKLASAVFECQEARKERVQELKNKVCPYIRSMRRMSEELLEAPFIVGFHDQTIWEVNLQGEKIKELTYADFERVHRLTCDVEAKRRHDLEKAKK